MHWAIFISNIFVDCVLPSMVSNLEPSNSSTSKTDTLNNLSDDWVFIEKELIFACLLLSKCTM